MRQKYTETFILIHGHTHTQQIHDEASNLNVPSVILTFINVVTAVFVTTTRI